MPLPQPTTRATRRLVLNYNRAGIYHSMGLNYVSGQEPTTAATAATDAAEWAGVAKEFLSTATTITDWKVTDMENNTIVSGSIGSPLHGTMPVVGADYLSYTRTFVGKGQPGTLGEKTGQTRVVFFNGDIGNDNPGTMYYNAASGSVEQTVIDWLNDSAKLGADFYGQKAQYSERLAVQFNAHTQRKHGS